ncbi:MAG: hypothetical protein AAGH89_13360 [Verrucomicrobiota bacterium]
MKVHTLTLLLAVSGVALAQEAETVDPAAADAIAPQNPNYFLGDNISLLDGLLSPHLHIVSAFGGTTAEDQADLALNPHDPQADATLQSLEGGLSLRAGMLQGFAVYSATTDADGELDGTLEEGFLKLVDLPFNLELRGGQFFNRFGFQNAVHNHGWQFVDINLVNGRFLTEGEYITQGGEVTWNAPTKWGPTALSLAYGGVPAHGHGEEEDHGHGEEAEFEADGAFFQDWTASANLVTRFDYNDFHQFTGIGSGAWGRNEFGRNTEIYGLGLQYEWRENGYDPGGKYVRWRTQAMARGIEVLGGHGHGEEHDEEEEGHDEEEEGHDEEEEGHDEEEEGHDEEEEGHDEEEEGHDEEEEIVRETLDEFGFYTMLAYGWNDRLETSIRGEWVSGIDEMGLDDRWRISPAMTFFLNDYQTSHLRLQYNYDISDSFGEDHSFWAQLSWTFGGPEVR